MTGFTAAAATELALGRPRKGEMLFLRALAADNWTRVHPRDWTLYEPDNEPVRLESTLTDRLLGFDAEADSANPCRILGHWALFELIGDERQCSGFGPVHDVKVAGPTLSFTGYDWNVLLHWLRTQATLEPDSVEVVDDVTKRAVSLLDDGGFGSAFGFTPDGSGTDPAFDEATQTQRRALQPSDWRVYRDSGDATLPNSGGYWEVPTKYWQVNATSGVFTILEDTTGKNYFVSGIRAYLESAATGATNVDFSRIPEQALAFDAGDGTSIAAGAPELDIEDSGLDLSGALTFPEEEGLGGVPADLITALQQRVASNFRLVFDPSGFDIDPDTGVESGTGVWRWRAVGQQPRGLEDRTLSRRGKFDKSRNAESLAAGVEVTGYTERPVQVLAGGGGITVTPTDLQPTADKWAFDGVSATSKTFAEAVALLYDGDDSMAMLVTGISGVTLKGWYDVASWALSEPVRISHVRARLPGTKNRNPDNQYIDGEGFWPGFALYGRMGGSDNWRPIIPRYYDKPTSLVELQGQQLNNPFVDQLKLELRAFKFGEKNQKDPGCAMGELAIYIGEHYRIVLLAQDTDPDGFFAYTNNQRHPVTASASGVHGTFTIAGDWRARFAAGNCFICEDSSGGTNDGKQMVLSSSFGSGHTVITVQGSVAASSASGTLRIAVNSYLPGLVARSQRQGGVPALKLASKDVGDQFNQYLARDVAAQLFDESTRAFESYSWSGPADAQVRRYETVKVADGGWRTGSAGFFVESKTTHNGPGGQGKGRSYTMTLTGRDYLAEAPSA